MTAEIGKCSGFRVWVATGNEPYKTRTRDHGPIALLSAEVYLETQMDIFLVDRKA